MAVPSLVSLCFPPGKQVPEAAYQALFHFDSRAAALLLKDLSKAGLGGRAVEVFDWLRNLEPGHPLGALCDVYTYTAMISMCIYQQARTRWPLIAKQGSVAPVPVQCMHACMAVGCAASL